MLYKGITVVYSHFHTKRINALYRQDVKLLNINLAVHIVTAVRYI